MKAHNRILNMICVCALILSACAPITVTSDPNPTATATKPPVPTVTKPPERKGVIAFFMRQGNIGGISIIRADGSGDPIVLSAHPTNDSKPSWSPDGSQIAFESLRDDVAGNKYMDIYLMNSDGSHLTRVTDTDGWYAQPDWSPDGNRLAIASDKEEKGNADLYILTIDTRKLIRLTDDYSVDRSPSWSPDATKIVFFSNRRGNWDVYTIDVETSETVQLTDNPGDDYHPDWSPDGQKILFSSNRDGDAEIYIMDADGKNQRRLTNTPGNDTDPEWSPDGNYFAYAHDTSGVGEIYVMNLNGTPPVLLFENATKSALGLPAWSNAANISSDPVFGPPFCLRDTNGDMKPDAVTNTFSTGELMPFVAFPYRNMSPSLSTSVKWDYENSDMDSLNMALAWKHGESGWYIAPAGGLPLSTIGPRNVTVQLYIGDELMQEIECEVIPSDLQETAVPVLTTTPTITSTPTASKTPTPSKTPTRTPTLPTSGNLALKQAVHASASTQYPASLAVDGNENTSWGAGDFPPQWIEVDLGSPATVTSFRLLVTQSPNGNTIHRILVGSSASTLVEVHRFEQATATGLWLTYTPQSPLSNIRFVRIETISSPSWVGWLEIEVIGER